MIKIFEDERRENVKRKYKRRYRWNLLGNHCVWYDITGRLDWINGKPMVVIGWTYLILVILNFVLKRSDVDVPELNMVLSHWGWHWLNLIVKILFWVLFVDGIIVRFLRTFTRGEYYCSYFVRLYKFPTFDNKAKVKEDLAWAWFLFTHPEIDYKLEELLNRYTTYSVTNNVEPDTAGYQREHAELLRKYSIHKDDKGKYYSLNDKKYRKKLEKL